MWLILYKGLKPIHWLCMWLLGTFSDLLAFGSVKIVKMDFFIKGAQFSIKSAKMGVFYKEVSPNITKNRDPWNKASLMVMYLCIPPSTLTTDSMRLQASIFLLSWCFVRQLFLTPSHSDILSILKHRLSWIRSQYT